MCGDLGEGADGEALNIGSTDNIDILTLAEEIRDQCAPGLDIEFAKRHAADAEHTHADTSKAHELLGYEPTYTIRGFGSSLICEPPRGQAPRHSACSACRRPRPGGRTGTVPARR